MQPSRTDAVSCPECGAPAPFRGTAVSLVCEYCGSTVVRTGVNLTLIGKVSALLDNGSPIVLGAKASFDKVPFEVVGRLQLRHGRGTWNEWFINFADGGVGWLSDAQGSYAITRPREKSIVAGKVPAYSGCALGQPIVVQGVPYVPVERRVASYQGAEGCLPFAAVPGDRYYSVDLRGHDGEFMTLDYGERPAHREPTLYMGHAVDLLAIGLHPLRKFAGWVTRQGQRT